MRAAPGEPISYRFGLGCIRAMGGTERGRGRNFN